MDKAVKQNLVDNYNNLLVKLQTDDINKLQLGFISDNCSSMLFSILVHCIENIEIFNKAQLSNISNFITKLSYGR